MKKFLRSTYRLMLLFGIDLRKLILSFAGVPKYIIDFSEIYIQQKRSAGEFAIRSFMPCLDDRFMESGNAKGHYFYQDWLVAKKIFENNPRIHVDVGSRIDGFVGHVATFRKIRVIDIRNLSTNVPNIEFIQQNIMEELTEDLVNCCDSLSCLHTLEHLGLGRYGDPVNYYGYLLGLENLFKMLLPGGKFYFSVPIGPQRIEFNAHRVFDVSYLLELFNKKFVIDSFSFVDDAGDLHLEVALEPKDISNNFGCFYGCGIFEMTKK